MPFMSLKAVSVLFLRSGSGSYGGYAALVGATFTPNLFCCAVDLAGPSNLLT